MLSFQAFLIFECIDNFNEWNFIAFSSKNSWVSVRVASLASVAGSVFM